MQKIGGNNVGFRIKKKEKLTFESPQEMYRDYKKRSINGPLDYQSKMIDLYLEKASKKSDVAFELPTGSGKTLIGLLIAEFRRKKNKEKVIYLCPNNQLVNQVVEKANSVYGMKVYGFTGSKKNYNPQSVSAYNRAEGIAITNYSTLFNTNSFFDDADIIIFDDAHSSESYIASNWSLRINRFEEKELFLSLVESLKDVLDSSQYNHLTENENDRDKNWFDKLPNLSLEKKIEQIMPIIEAHTQNTNLHYSWQNIRNHLHACNMFFSSNEILIRPYIPPTMTHHPFAQAKQRIYMSATLGESGELERITGVQDIYRLPIVKEWGIQSIGRRFFLFPNASFKESESHDLLIRIKKLQKRALILSQNDTNVETIKKLIEKKSTSEVFLSKDIEKTQENFIQSEDAVAILANRYDGIDLDGEKCNLLMLLSLPSATHLQEKFLTSRMAASILFDERVKTRIVQAVGRCTRSDVDYAAVVIFGTELENALMSPRKIVQFQPELRAELEFGFAQSENLDDPEMLIDTLRLFFERGEEWEDAEEAIISSRDEIEEEDIPDVKKNFEKLRMAASHEVQFQYALWKEDYEEALKHNEKVLSFLEEDVLKGYAGFWNYNAGYIAYQIYKTGLQKYLDVSKKFYRNASDSTKTINWFNKLLDQRDSISTSITDEGISNLLERLENQIVQDGVKTSTLFEQKAKSILTDLHSEDGNDFERGHLELGKLLGYISENASGDSDPDPWWMLNEDLCIVAEDKIYKNESKALPTRHVKQAGGHEKWIREKVKYLRKNASILTIMLTNSNLIEKSAVTFADDIFYVNRTDFINWAVTAIEAVRKMRRSFSQPGDVVWRLEAEKILREHNSTPTDLIQFIKKKELKNISII